MAVGLQFGIDQFAVDGHLEAPAIRRYQGECIDFWFKFFEQFGCQTGSPVGIVSNRAVDQLDFQHIHLLAVK